jgi:hypothetical protein
MNKKTLVFLGLVLAVGMPNARAQSSTPLIAKIPFDFNAGEKTYPAGEYRIASGPSQFVIHIRSTGGQHGGFVMTMPVGANVNRPAGEGRLLFHRYGDKYFLSEVWGSGETTGRELRKTREEVELAKRFAPANLPVVAGTKSRNN